MLEHKFVGQPGGGTVLGQLVGLADRGYYTRLDVSVAYARVTGVDQLARSMPGSWSNLEKRWLAAIDWCRSEPVALDALAQLPNSTVCIFDGAAVVRKPSCFPNVSFHPKGFIFHSSDARALVVGSGNLSANGLRGGHEADATIAVSNPSGPAEQSAWDAIGSAITWFDRLWTDATSWASIRQDYRSQYESSQVAGSPVPVDDHAGNSSRIGTGRGFSAEDLVKLRNAEHFWIEARTLYKNRGAGQPGNQLDMRALTRVFFGAPADDVEPNHHFGELTIAYAGTDQDDRALRYGDNDMDKLNLPVPGSPGAPTTYDDEFLLFERVTTNARQKFRLALAGSEAQVQRWRDLSQQNGAYWTMGTGSTGREFGAF